MDDGDDEGIEPTSDRAGTGGIQMFLADIDIEPNVTPLVAFGTL